MALGLRGGIFPSYKSARCFASSTDMAAPVSTRQRIVLPLMPTSTISSPGLSLWVELAANFFWGVLVMSPLPGIVGRDWYSGVVPIAG